MLPLDDRKPNSDLINIGNNCELICHSKIFENNWTCCILFGNQQWFFKGESNFVDLQNILHEIMTSFILCRKQLMSEASLKKLCESTKLKSLLNFMIHLNLIPFPPLSLSFPFMITTNIIVSYWKTMVLAKLKSQRYKSCRKRIRFLQKKSWVFMKQIILGKLILFSYPQNSIFWIIFNSKLF